MSPNSAANPLSQITPTDPADHHAFLGEFNLRSGPSAQPVPTRLFRTETGIRAKDLAGGDQQFRWGFSHWGGVILVANDATCVRVLPQDQVAEVLAAIFPLPASLPAPDGRFCSIAFTDDGPEGWPVRLTFTDQEVIFGDTHMPLNRAGRITVSITLRDFRILNFYPEDSSGSDVCLYVPPLLADEIAREWDRRSFDTRLAGAKIADLYTMYNAVRKEDLLIALFSDILLLNRKLNEPDDDYPMEDLVSYLATMGAFEFAKNAEMQESMLAKVLVLTLMLPPLKQNFEVLSTMYPYYWIRQDARWLEEAFGLDPKSAEARAESRRLIPQIRREVRAIQGNNQRALGEMETVARSLDAVLARQETHEQWQSKVRKYVPVGMQGLFASGLIVFSGGTNPAAWNMLGNFLASGVLGNLCSMMLQDQEAKAQIQRVAGTLIPWWHVFMQTSVVSIFEAAQFVDEQNIAAMQRDKAMLDQVKEAERPAALARLQAALRGRIRAHREKLLHDKLAGGTVSLQEIIDDLHDAIGRQMDQEVSYYITRTTNYTEN